MTRRANVQKIRSTAIQGLDGVRIVEVNGEVKLELRHSLSMRRGIVWTAR